MTPQPPLPALAAYILDTEAEGFISDLRDNTNFRLLPDQPPEVEARFEALMSTIVAHGAIGLSEQDVVWLALNGQGHVYCDALRASPELCPHWPTLQAHLGSLPADGRGEHLIGRMGWEHSRQDLMSQFIEGSGLSKSFEAFLADKAIAELAMGQDLNQGIIQGAQTPEAPEAPEHELTPEQLADKYGSATSWGEHPTYPRSDWEHEVSNGDSQAGYWPWVASQLEMALLELATPSPDPSALT